MSENGPFVIHTQFKSEEMPSGDDFMVVQYVLKYPAQCKSMKIEFAEVTPNQYNLQVASACEMYLIGETIPAPNNTVSSDPGGLINVTCDKLEYSGSWSICLKDADANLGSTTFRRNSNVTLKFIGKKVHVLGYIESAHSSALIRIDDEIVGFPFFEYKCDSSRCPDREQIIFSSKELPYGEHTIVIQNLVDLFTLIIKSIIIDPVPKDEGYVLKYCDFKVKQGTWSSNGNYRFGSTSSDAEGTFEFFGTRFWLTGVRGSTKGYFRMFIDEGNSLTIDETNTDPIAQDNYPVLLYQSEELENKFHTVRIQGLNDRIELCNLIFTSYPHTKKPDETVLTNQEGLINITCDKFQYSNWTNHANGICVYNSSANHGSFTRSSGATAAITFVGKKVHVLAWKQESSGFGKIKIDDEVVAIVSFNSGYGLSYYNNRYPGIVFSSDDLPYGEHKIEIINNVYVNGATSIALGSIYVDPLPKEKGYKLGYDDFIIKIGEWKRNETNPSVFSSDSENAEGSFEFFGNHFYLTGVRSMYHGLFEIIIDESEPIFINETQSADVAQYNFPVVLYESDELEDKSHIVRIRKTTHEVSLVGLMFTTNVDTIPIKTPAQVTSSSLIYPSYEPTPMRTLLPQVPIENSVSDSNIFELTSFGYIDSTNKHILVENTSETIKAVSFQSRNVKILERSPYYSYNPLYFIASNENSQIKIDEKLNYSNIGFCSDKQPSISIPHEDISFMSLMNQIYPESEITFLSTSIENIRVKEIINRMGKFTINVDKSIREISTIKLTMQFISSLLINKAKLHVIENFTILGESEITIENLQLDGIMNVHSDSKVQIEEISFSEGSTIEISIEENSNENDPLFSIQKVNNIPTKIILSAGKSLKDSFNQKIKIFEINHNNKEQIKCSNLIDHISFKGNDKEVKIQAKDCEDSSDFVILTFSSDYFKDGKTSGSGNKFPIGGIIGIVVGVIVVIAIVVFVVIFLRRRNMQNVSVGEIAGIETTNRTDSITEEEANMAI